MELLRTPKSAFESPGWTSKSAQLLTSENLNALFEGRIPAIILPSFISAGDCNEIVSNLKTLGMGTYSHVSHPVGRLGLAQMEYHMKNDKAGYFDRVKSANETYKDAIGCAQDPVEKLISYLKHVCSSDVTIANEMNYGPYFAGSFRNVMTLGHLHYDFAPFEAKGWDISAVEQQLSWNLYLNQPLGGNLHVYKRFYEPADEALRVKGDYFYDMSVVSGAERYTYSPRVGDVIIFNCRYFHEVKAVQGDRYSLSSFIGRLPTGDLILWS